MESTNYFKTLIVCCIILLQVPNNWCADISPAVVKLSYNFQVLCSGVLVGPTYVLTSATCVEGIKAENLLVMANVDFSQFRPEDIAAVADINIPKEYNKDTNVMDVAMIELKHAFGTKIEPAALCTRDSITPGTQMTLFNWSLYYNGLTSATDAVPLLKTDLTVSDSALCAKTYQEKYTDTTICAANTKESSCLYDISGPASIGSEVCAFYILGNKCISKEKPGSFTNLAEPKVKQFIRGVLQKNQ